MNEIKQLREQLDDFVADADVVCLDDEAWYERLWTLLDPVIDARIERTQQAVDKIVQPSLTGLLQFLNEPYRDPETGEIR